LGRPPADVERQKAVAKQARQDELDRIPIEGKFGQGKRRFSLSRIMCKLAITSEAAILVAFVVMNLEKWLKGHFFALFSCLTAPIWSRSRWIMPPASRYRCICPGSNFGLVGFCRA
jgi:hypothetical protein